MNTLTHDAIVAMARDCGFDDAGIAPVALPHETDRLNEWTGAGYAGDMGWLERNGDVRLDLRERFPWARSVVMTVQNYRPNPVRPSQGLARYVSNYALGPDYHDVLLPQLTDLAGRLERKLAREFEWHAYVDTGPVLERQMAQSGGLGWLGKNTLLLDAKRGSYFFLGTLITDLDLMPSPGATGSCGTCRACQPACPTDAFVEPGVLDARRCISYLTIEYRGAIDRSLRPAMGEWLFGCDLCQTSCPFNFESSDSPHETWQRSSALLDLDLPELLEMDDDEFRSRFRHTPLWRPRRHGLVRNALIVIANARRFDCLPEVRRRLRDDSATVREAASWCVAVLQDLEALPHLEGALALEREPWVREALRGDLSTLRSLT